jgi:hypothetical protein
MNEAANLLREMLQAKKDGNDKEFCQKTHEFNLYVNHPKHPDDTRHPDKPLPKFADIAKVCAEFSGV